MKKSLIAAVLLAASAFAQAEDITVSAAASLKEAFTDIARQYEKQHPDAKIKLNTAASGTLLQQLAQGAADGLGIGFLLGDVLPNVTKLNVDAAYGLVVKNKAGALVGHVFSFNRVNNGLLYGFRLPKIKR